MENDKDKALDLLLRRFTQEAGLEEPSKDFTNAVMTKVNLQVRKPNVFLYRPLIPGYVWWVCALVFVALLLFMLFGAMPANTLGSTSLNFDSLTANPLIDFLDGLMLPDTLAYGALVLAIFVILQVYLVKMQWEKQLVFK